MTTKIEWAVQIKKAGLALPENWGKLSTARAEVLKNKLLGTANKTVMATIGSGIGRAAGAILAMGAAAVNATEEVVKATAARAAYNEPSEVRMAQVKKATMPKNPNWGRSEKAPGKTQFYPVRRFAADPDPMTRQVRRQIERRADKQPVFMRQRQWHEINGFGKVGGKRA